MFYEHKRSWYLGIENINKVLSDFVELFGEASEEEIRTVFLEKDIRFLITKTRQETTRSLILKTTVAKKTFLENIYEKFGGDYLDKLEAKKVLPYIDKRRYLWEIEKEGKSLKLCIDVYGSCFAKVHLTEKNTDKFFSDFIDSYIPTLGALAEVTTIDTFKESGMAYALYINGMNYNDLYNALNKSLKEVC